MPEWEPPRRSSAPGCSASERACWENCWPPIRATGGRGCPVARAMRPCSPATGTSPPARCSAWSPSRAPGITARNVGTASRRGTPSSAWPARLFGPPRDRNEAIAVLRRAVELGVDHIDTAQYYGPDVANELIRAALYPYPEGLALVSKVG